MVKLLKFSVADDNATVLSTKNDIFDIVNGLDVITGHAENDIAQFGGDAGDIAQMERYKECLAGMQAVKESLTG